MDLKLTQHVKERYAQRIMGRQEKIDASIFVARHEDKIVKDIENMVKYGETIYKGPPLNDKNGQPVSIILNGSWVVIMDPKVKRVITLFKIDLGLDKEFNDNYILRLKEQLEESKKQYEEAKKKIDSEIGSYKESLADNQSLINEYRSSINALETQNRFLQGLIDEAENNKYIAGKCVRDAVGAFTGKPVF